MTRTQQHLSNTDLDEAARFNEIPWAAYKAECVRRGRGTPVRVLGNHNVVRFWVSR